MALPGHGAPAVSDRPPPAKIHPAVKAAAKCSWGGVPASGGAMPPWFPSCLASPSSAVRLEPEPGPASCTPLTPRDLRELAANNTANYWDLFFLLVIVFLWLPADDLCTVTALLPPFDIVSNCVVIKKIIHVCFCHDYFASALISYFPFGVLHAVGATKTPKRRLIHTLAAQASEITSLISHPTQSPVWDPNQVYTTHVLEKRGRNHCFHRKGPIWPFVPVCRGGSRLLECQGWPGQWHRYNARWHREHSSWITGEELGWSDTVLPVSAPSVQPFVFSGDWGSPQIYSSVSLFTWD